MKQKVLLRTKCKSLIKAKHLFCALALIWFNQTLFSQFAPAVGENGTTAIHKDSPVFSSWATNCTINRGYQNIADSSLGFTTVGKDSSALGPAGENGVVSLGDGGEATLYFSNHFYNGEDWDFAVFENAFDNFFLELAFVEVSTNGNDFVRFPSTSNSPTQPQVGSFDSLDTKLINNLAGKYRGQYGTPFDLEELADSANINIDSIHYIRIIDVVGSIQEIYRSYDMYGNIINDPWPTPFASGGFDLDAVGIIHSSKDFSSTIELNKFSSFDFKVYPNSLIKDETINIIGAIGQIKKINLYDLNGRSIIESNLNGHFNIDKKHLLWKNASLQHLKGFHILEIQCSEHRYRFKLLFN